MQKNFLILLVLIFAGLSVALGVSVGKIGTELDEYRIARMDWQEDLAECEAGIDQLNEAQAEIEQLSAELTQAQETLSEKEQEVTKLQEELTTREAELIRLKAQVVRLQSRVPAESVAE